MNQVTLYELFRDVCIAQSNSPEWKKVNAFGVGYLSDVNTDNLEQSSFRKEFFYSEKWNEAGKPEDKPVLDFPFCLITPLAGDGTVERDGTKIKGRSFSITMYVLDLYAYDRHNVQDSDYARRTREEIWNDTMLIGEQLLMQLNAAGNASTPKFSIQNNGKYEMGSVFDMANKRLAGTEFTFTVLFSGTCDLGSFDSIPPAAGVGVNGDLVYWNSNIGKWVRLHPGTEGEVLTIGSDGLPAWEPATGGGLTCETIGDCPAIQAIVESVETVTDDLAQEILDRAAADDSLQDAIDDEITNRTNADNDLQTAIDNEATARANADADLQSAIDTEINDRQSADADLQTNIDNITLEDVRAMSNEIQGDIDANGNTVTNLSAPVNASDAVPKSYVDGLIDTTIKVLEGYDPTITSLYPTTWGGNAIRKGDSFKFTVAGNVNGIPVTVGDFAIAQINAPGQTDANWMIGQTNVDQASESAQGIAKIATQAQVEDENSTNNTNIVTPQKLWLGLAHFVTIAWTWTAKQIFSLAPRFSSVGANHVLTVDGSKDLTSEAKASAFNKAFGFTTTDIVEIGANLSASQTVETDSNKKLITAAKGTAYNKDFGTGTTNIPEIGSALGNSLPLQTTAAGKLQTVTVAAFKTLLALVKGDVGLGNVPNVDTTPSSFGVSLDAQGAVIATGSSGSVTIPYAGTINNWYLSADVSGSIVIDVKRSGASIVGAGNKPTVSSSTSANAAVSGWTSSSVSAGDIISFNVDSATTMTKATLVIKMTRT